MFAGNTNNLNRFFLIIGAILLAWGMQQLIEIGNPSEAQIQERIDAIYSQEMHRMEQAQLNRLAKMKDELETMSEEEKALILMQASRPIQLTPEQEAKHRKAIRRDITAAHEHKKKKASALTFAGGALIFLMLSPIFSNWVSRKILNRMEN